ncbi:MAG: glycosyltransferase family 4 protein [Clostridiales bacterium]|nr:glycosyltransferase family 4 protein [Clostridiales bacterium]
MQKVLIVCSHYFDDTDANAICVRNLVEELILRRNEVFVITDTPTIKTENNNELCHFVFVKESLYQQLEKTSRLKVIFKAYSIVRRIINLIIYPNVSPIRSRNIIKEAKRIIKENKIDIYLMTYRPFESIQSGFKIAKLYKNIKFIAYHLDNIESASISNRIIKNILCKKSLKTLHKEQSVFDKLLVTPTSAASGGIIEVVGFPLYRTVPRVASEIEFDKDCENIVYVGTLNRENRNPGKAFEFLEKYKELSQKKIKVHIWGRIDGIDDVLDRFKSLVEYHGFIDNQYVEDIYEKADYLLNIGNTITIDMLPSKIFRMFATNKPIISFNKPNDISVKYLEKYPKSIIVTDYTADVSAFSDEINIVDAKDSEEMAELTLFKASYIVDKILDN